MDDTSIQHVPETAQSDTPNYSDNPCDATFETQTDNTPNAESVNTQVEGAKSDEELLEGLLTDSYCYVCSSTLQVEDHRVTHYQGKKHAQKVKVYLNALREENTDSSKLPLLNDRNRFCEICKMIFSSDVVAKSHYEGKVHAKTLRKQTPHLTAPEVNNSTNLPQSAALSDQKSANDKDVPADAETKPAPESTPDSGLTEEQLKGCSICSSIFNNLKTAMQHYNGKKHIRNVSRQEFLKELGGDGQQGVPLACKICEMKFNSVEMYKSHMQGSRHQTKAKESTTPPPGGFTKELDSYIQALKTQEASVKTEHGNGEHKPKEKSGTQKSRTGGGNKRKVVGSGGKGRGMKRQKKESEDRAEQNADEFDLNDLECVEDEKKAEQLEPKVEDEMLWNDSVLGC